MLLIQRQGNLGKPNLFLPLQRMITWLLECLFFELSSELSILTLVFTTKCYVLVLSHIISLVPLQIKRVPEQEIEIIQSNPIYKQENIDPKEIS